MITISTWQSWVIVGFAGYGLGELATRAWRFVRGGLQRWRIARASRRSQVLKPYLGKLIRHAKTGRVGLCLGAGAMNTARGELGVEVCFCHSCVKAITSAHSAGDTPRAFAHSMIARQSGHTSALLASEVTIAPASDAAAFRAEMEQSQPEGDNGI